MNNIDRDFKAKSALRAQQAQFVPTAEVPPVRPSTMDPIEEQRLRVQARTANPSGAARGPTPLPQATEIPRAEFDAARAARRPAVDFGASRSDQLAEESMRRAQAASRATNVPGRMATATEGALQAGKTGVSRLGAAASRVGSALRAAPGALGRAAVGTLGKAGLAGAGIASIPTIASTGTEDYAKRFGVDLGSSAGPGGEAGVVGRDLALRTLGAASDVANAATFGTLGRVFADKQGAQDPALAGGQAPMIITGDNNAQIPQSALRLTPEQAAAQQANGGITPTSARTGDPNEVLGTFQGRAITRGMSDNMGGNVQGAPQEDPIQGALRNMLRQQGSGATMVNSRAGEINNQFDALQKQIIDTYGGKAQGTMMTKLLDLQNARADALGQDQGARVSSQGNVVSADNSVRGQQTAALSDMVSSRNTDKTVGGSLLREQLQGIREADQARRAAAKDSGDTFLADITAQAPTDKDNKPLAGFRPDEIMSRLAKTNPEVMYMDRGPRNQLIASTIAAMQSGQNFNDTRGLMGTEDSTATPQGIYKDETNLMDGLAMYTGGNSVGTIAKHVLNPFRSDQAVNMGVDKDGNPVLAYADDVMGDERFQQEVAKSALRKQKGK